MKQPKIESHIVGAGGSAGNGSLPEVGAPANYEQIVNKGAGKKAEGFTLCFLLVALGANYLSSPTSHLR